MKIAEFSVGSNILVNNLITSVEDLVSLSTDVNTGQLVPRFCRIYADNERVSPLVADETMWFEADPRHLNDLADAFPEEVQVMGRFAPWCCGQCKACKTEVPDSKEGGSSQKGKAPQKNACKLASVIDAVRT